MAQGSNVDVWALYAESQRKKENQRRAYKACIPCRQRKAKCDLGGQDGPPCLKCRREQRECVFSKERSTKKRKLSERNDTVDADAGHQDGPSAARSESRGLDITEQSQGLASPREQQRVFQPGPSSTPSNVPRSPSKAPDFQQSMMRTVVSNGNDALDLLFQAATREQQRSGGSSASSPRPTAGVDVLRATSGNRVIPDPAAVTAGPSASQDVRKLWASTRFVKMGWFSADEAINYVDLFFKNINPMSPVLSEYYSDHTRHRELITTEPLLCCTILMISSRHNLLSGPGGASRGYFIHERLWRHCQQFINRLLLGQEKGSNAKTRTLGTVEALLLISEWHPRSLHFPPESDGWDSDLIQCHDDTLNVQSQNPPHRWLEDVVEPARRSDRMSWMLLGCALTLSHELHVFGEVEIESGSMAPLVLRRNRIRKLLFVFLNQLASRLGCGSMLPHNLNLSSIAKMPSSGRTNNDVEWDRLMLSWLELNRLLKTLTEMVFPTKSEAKITLRGERYVGILEHFLPLIEQWREKHISTSDDQPLLADILFIEYQYARIYCNSIGMQAVCERHLSDGNASIIAENTSIDIDDQANIQEVIDGSCDLLERVISLAARDILRFAPVRVFLRTTTASIFLFKAMGINVRTAQVKSALSVLDRTVQALRTSVLDDMHLANSYAVLLEMHVRRFRRGLMASNGTNAGRLSNDRSSMNAHNQGTSDQANNSRSYGAPADPNDPGPVADWYDPSLLDNMPGGDWLSLPFDATMAPLSSGMTSSFPIGLESNGLDFIWRLPDLPL